MTVRIYLLLLFTLLAGCGADEAIRELEVPEPDLPVIDIGAYDIVPGYFVFRLVIEPAAQGHTFVQQIGNLHGICLRRLAEPVYHPRP